jgi:hypothetical protein
MPPTTFARTKTIAAPTTARIQTATKYACRHSSNYDLIGRSTPEQPTAIGFPGLPINWA